MTSLTLADIQAAADEEYGPLTLEDIPGGTVQLLPLIRLSHEKRTEIVSLSSTPKPKKTAAKKAAARSGSPAKRASAKVPDAPGVAEGLAAASRFERILELAAETPEQGARLIACLDGDIAKLKFIFTKWSEQQQAGEATPSPS